MKHSHYKSIASCNLIGSSDSNRGMQVKSILSKPTMEPETKAWQINSLGYRICILREDN